MKVISAVQALFAVGLALQLSAAAQAQDKTTAPQAAAKTAENWLVSCVSPARIAPAECSMEQRVVLRETGQLLGRILIKVSGSDTGPGALLVQIPLGVSIRGGVKMKVDGKELAALEIQTCDASGCYAGGQLGEELLAGMKSGKTLSAEFGDMQRRPISANFVLAGFSSAYQAIQ